MQPLDEDDLLELAERMRPSFQVEDLPPAKKHNKRLSYILFGVIGSLAFVALLYFIIQMIWVVLIGTIGLVFILAAIASK